MSISELEAPDSDDEEEEEEDDEEEEGEEGEEDEGDDKNEATASGLISVDLPTTKRPQKRKRIRSVKFLFSVYFKRLRISLLNWMFENNQPKFI